jgi:hypothetical protein
MWPGAAGGDWASAEDVASTNRDRPMVRDRVDMVDSSMGLE